MKKLFSAAVAAPSLALAMTFASASGAEALPPPSPESRTVYVGETDERARGYLRADTLEAAQCAIDTVFPEGEGKDRFLAKAYETLKDMLARLPAASYAEREDIHRDAFELRLQLESNNYKYHYVEAAHAVAMAANVATSVSAYGHEWSPIYSGDMDQVSAALTRDAVKATFIYKDRNADFRACL